MKTLFEILVGLHLVGAIAVAWGVASAWKSHTINAAMLHGASTQFLTGILMVGLAQSSAVDENFSNGTVGIKLLVVLAMLGAIMKGRRAKGDTTMWWAAVGVLWLVNVVLGSSLAG